MKGGEKIGPIKRGSRVKCIGKTLMYQQFSFCRLFRRQFTLNNVPRGDLLKLVPSNKMSSCYFAGLML